LNSSRAELAKELEELRKKRERGIKLTRKESFRLLAQDAMRRYMKANKWSTSELEIKEILKQLGFKNKIHYLHNWKIMNRRCTGYYSLDFFFPTLSPPRVIEVNPSIWHSKMGNCDLKDRRKKRFLEQLGFRVLFITSYLLSKNKFLKERISTFLK